MNGLLNIVKVNCVTFRNNTVKYTVKFNRLVHFQMIGGSEAFHGTNNYIYDEVLLCNKQTSYSYATLHCSNWRRVINVKCRS